MFDSDHPIARQRERRRLLALAAAGLAAPFTGALAQDSGGYRFSPVNQYGISLTAAYWNPIIAWVSEDQDFDALYVYERGVSQGGASRRRRRLFAQRRGSQ